MGILALIEATLSLIEHGAALLPKLQEIAKQQGELTDEQSAEYTARQEAAFATWQSNAAKGNGK